jgi:hypothetical protein
MYLDNDSAIKSGPGGSVIPKLAGFKTMIEHAAQIETVKWPDYSQGVFHLIAIFNNNGIPRKKTISSPTADNKALSASVHTGVSDQPARTLRSYQM